MGTYLTKKAQIIGLIVLCAVLFLGCEAPLKKLSSQEIYERAVPSVFIIEYHGRYVLYGTEPTSLGSGFAISENEVVTNRHVILEFPGLIRVRQGDKRWRAFVSYLDNENDICLLTVPGLEAKPVKMNVTEDVRVGDKVFAVGAPHGLERSFSDGVVSGIREPDDTVKIRAIQITAPISPGSSGGGLFDAKGHLIGMTTASLRRGQNLNFAVPADPIFAAIPKSRSKTNRMLTLGIAYLQAGELEKAGATLQETLNHNSEIAEAWYVRYLVAQALKARNASTDSEGSQETSLDDIALLEEALKLNPSFAESFWALAFAHFDAGNQERTKYQNSAFKKLGKFSRDSGISWEQWSKSFYGIYHFLPAGATYHYEQARFLMEQAHQISSDNVEYLALYADVCLSLGEQDEALGYIKRVLRLEPRNLRALDLLQSYYRKIGDPDAVRATCLRIIETTPRSSRDCSLIADAAFNLRGYFVVKGDPEQASVYRKESARFRVLRKSFDGKNDIQNEKDRVEAQEALAKLEQR